MAKHRSYSEDREYRQRILIKEVEERKRRKREAQDAALNEFIAHYDAQEDLRLFDVWLGEREFSEELVQEYSATNPTPTK